MATKSVTMKVTIADATLMAACLGKVAREIKGPTAEKSAEPYKRIESYIRTVIAAS